MKRFSRIKREFALTGAVLLFCVLVLSPLAHVSVPAHAQGTQPPLGTAGNFAVLGASAVTNTGSSVVTGDLGVSPGTSVTGFPPGIVIGTKHVTDAVALQAQNDVAVAYGDAAGQPCNVPLTGQDLGGKTLTSGVYCFSSSAQLTGQLKLDSQGNPASVFIFQIGSTLTTASNASVLQINETQACNIFWQVGSSATVGTSTNFSGNILAHTSITAQTNAEFNGSLYAQTGAVTLDTNTIIRSPCTGSTPTGTPTSSPPTGTPTSSPPTGTPTSSPPTGTPTSSPPTGTPTSSPTGTPISSPTGMPTSSPTGTPISSPTGTPISSPTGTPISSPTGTPTGPPGLPPTGSDPDGAVVFLSHQPPLKLATVSNSSPMGSVYRTTGKQSMVVEGRTLCKE